MNYVFRAAASLAEVVGTTLLKRTNDFTSPLPSLVTIIAYGVACYCLSRTLRTIPTGVAYALWSGVGIVLIAAIAWAVDGHKLPAAAILGMTFIIAGVGIMNLFSTSAGH